MKTKIHEVKAAGKIIDRVEVQQFESVNEAIFDLNSETTLALINKGYKQAQLNEAAIKLKKSAKDGVVADWVIRKYRALTSDEERTAFCQALKVEYTVMATLAGEETCPPSNPTRTTAEPVAESAATASI